MIRWYLDLAFVGRVCVGKVWQGPPPEDIPRGSIRPAALWSATGMLTDWCDTQVGTEYLSRGQAKSAIEGWWRQQQ